MQSMCKVARSRNYSRARARRRDANLGVKAKGLGTLYMKFTVIYNESVKCKVYITNPGQVTSAGLIPLPQV